MRCKCKPTIFIVLMWLSDQEERSLLPCSNIHQGNDLDVASLNFHRKLGVFIKSEIFYQGLLLTALLIKIIQ